MVLNIASFCQLPQFDLIKKYVDTLRTETSFMYENFYIEGWQAVIDNAFDAIVGNEENLESVCLGNILRIQV